MNGPPKKGQRPITWGITKKKKRNSNSQQIQETRLSFTHIGFFLNELPFSPTISAKILKFTYTSIDADVRKWAF